MQIEIRSSTQDLLREAEELPFRPIVGDVFPIGAKGERVVVTDTAGVWTRREDGTRVLIITGTHVPAPEKKPTTKANP